MEAISTLFSSTTSFLLVFVVFISTEVSSTSNCFTTRNVTVGRTTRNFGFHRNIVTKLEWLTNQKGLVVEKEANCKFLLKEYLPRGLYVDLDQIKEREKSAGPKVFSKVRINTEAPAHKSREHEIFVFVQAYVNYREDGEIMTADIELPIHLRYQEPKMKGISTTVSLSQPKVLVLCTKDGVNVLEKGCGHLLVEAPCSAVSPSSDVCQWLPLHNIPQVGGNWKGLEQTFSVPVGRKEHKSIVMLVTTLCTGFGALYILWPTSQSVHPQT